jgi:hypothetical protein
LVLIGATKMNECESCEGKGIISCCDFWFGGEGTGCNSYEHDANECENCDGDGFIKEQLK